MRKKYSLPLSATFLFLLFALVNSCQKDYVAPQPKPSNSFVEEFDTVANLYNKGWIFVNNSQPQGAASWQQGVYSTTTSKTGLTYNGFPAYSYKYAADEYIFAGYASGSGTATLSSWMITPSVEIKNGDKISFYTRTYTGSQYPDRLQVRINPTDNAADVGFSASSIGKFTTLLADINPNLTLTGYPQTWTKYEYTISGLSASLKSRIAFRYYVPNGGPNGANSNAIGIDQLKFESQ